MVKVCTPDDTYRVTLLGIGVDFCAEAVPSDPVAVVILVVGEQLDEGVLILGDIEINIPDEVLSLDGDKAKAKLNSLVADQTGIDLPGGESALRGHHLIEDLVLRVLSVEIEVSIESSLEETELRPHLI